MFFMRFALLHLAILLIGPYSLAQDCTNLILENRIISGTHLVRTQKMSLVVRGGYTYYIEFIADEQGLYARMTSVGGMSLNLNDKVEFTDAANRIRAYKFISPVEVMPGIEPKYRNNLQLDLDAMEWLANTTISDVSLISYVETIKLKYPLSPRARTEIRDVCTCFLNALASEAAAPAPKNMQNSKAEAPKPSEPSQPNVLTVHEKGQDAYEKYPAYLKRAMELLSEEPNKHNTILSQKRYLEGYLISKKIAGESSVGVRDSLLELAKRKYLEAIDLEPGAAHIYYAIGALYFNNSPAQTDSVLFWHSKAIEYAPTWLLPYLDLSYEYMLSGTDLPTSEYWLKKALEQRPHSYVVLERLSWLYLWENRTKESLVLCDTMIAWMPGLFNAYSTKGQVYMMRNELREAEACFRRSIEIEPELHNWANVYQNQLLGMTRRWPQAKTSLDQVMLENRMDSSALSEIINQTLLPLCFQHKIVEAGPYFEKLIALQVSPQYIAAGLTGLGIISYKKGELQEAKTYFLKSLKTDPKPSQNTLVSNVYLALIAEKQGNTVKSDRLFQAAFKSVQDISALEKSYVYGSCRLAYGQFLIQRKRYSDARKQFQLAEKFQPNCSRAQYGYALLASAGKQNDEALDYLEKALMYWYPESESILEEPLFKKIRRTNRFKALMVQYFPEQYQD